MPTTSFQHFVSSPQFDPYVQSNMNQHRTANTVAVLDVEVMAAAEEAGNNNKNTKYAGMLL